MKCFFCRPWFLFEKKERRFTLKSNLNIKKYNAYFNMKTDCILYINDSRQGRGYDAHEGLQYKGEKGQKNRL